MIAKVSHTKDGDVDVWTVSNTSVVFRCTTVSQNPVSIQVQPFVDPKVKEDVDLLNYLLGQLLLRHGYIAKPTIYTLKGAGNVQAG